MTTPTIAAMDDDQLIAHWDDLRREEQIAATEIRRRLISHRAFRLRTERQHQLVSSGERRSLPHQAEMVSRAQALISNAGF